MEKNHNVDSIASYLQTFAKSSEVAKAINRFPKFNESFNAMVFWNLFLVHYEYVNNEKFIVTESSKTFVFTILYYFLQEQNFYKSPLLFNYDKCKTSLQKGLIVVGGFGVGKTSTVRTIVSLIEKLSVNYRLYPVRFHNTLEIVEEFESSDSIFKNDVINRYSKGFRVFDDVKNEREASNFGKIDLFKEILYKRCETKNYRTILLCNYDSEYPNDVHQAIESFERYGDRNFDRLFEAFNFIEFKGRSNRS